MPTLNQVRKAMYAQPFRPFTLHLADGWKFVVSSFYCRGDANGESRV